MLKSEKGFKELMKTLDKFFMKDKDSEKLAKATEYFSACREKEENVRDLLVRQEKLRNDWKRKEGDREELEGLLLVHQSGINDNDYHVAIVMCGEDRRYENVWKSMKKIFGGREEGRRKNRKKQFVDGRRGSY